MFGNLVNNKQLVEFCRDGVISIKPFEADLIKAVHYPLFIKSIYTSNHEKSWKRAHSFEENNEPYVLEPNQYVVVEVREYIVIREGIIGQFLPASNLIEAGLGLTAGRLEYPFGQRGEKIRFGLHNLLNIPNEVVPFHKVAYVQFFDLRGLASRYIVVTQSELEFFAQRISDVRRAHAEDAGPFYPEEGSFYRIDTTRK